MTLLAAQVCLAAPALAATAGIDSEHYAMYFDAAPGERNSVSVAVTSGDSSLMTVRDTRAPLTAAEGCDQVDVHTVQCWIGLIVIRLDDGDDTLDASVDTEVDAGPGNDVINVTGNDNRVSGGDGDDRLLGKTELNRLGEGDVPEYLNMDRLDGGAGRDFVSGGAGRDYLSGGDGGDAVRGGNGDDNLYDDQGNDDVQGEGGDDTLYVGLGTDGLSGGEGYDTVSYTVREFESSPRICCDPPQIFGRTAPVFVDPNVPGGDGEVGEADNVNPDVEAIVGSTGDDRLTVSAMARYERYEDANNSFDRLPRLMGLQGDDILVGGADRDELLDGSGSDILFGGDGGDELEADHMYGEFGDLAMGGPGWIPLWESDTIIAGPGDDRISTPEGRDVVDAGDGNDLISSDDLSNVPAVNGVPVGADDELTCGGGDDLVATQTTEAGYFIDGIGADCERVMNYSDHLVPFPITREAANMRVPMGCDTDTRIGCTGVARIEKTSRTRGRVVVARREFALARGTEQRLKLKITRRGEKVLRKRSKLRARLVIVRIAGKGLVKTATPLQLTVEQR